MPRAAKQRPAAAFLVTVDLVLVAKRLSRSTGSRVNIYAAAIELTAPYVTEENGKRESALSPFAATSQLGVFYAECQPEDLLDRGEIIRVAPSRLRHRTADGELMGDE